MSDSRRAAIGATILVLFAGAAATDRFGPVPHTPARRVSPLAPSGVLACPFVSAGTGRSWLHLANVGTASSKVTISILRQGAGPISRTLSLAAGRAVTYPVDPAVRQPSGGIVRFAGGEIAASRTSVLTTPEGYSGAVAGPCTPAGGRTLVSATGSTLNADTTLYLLNPSEADAVASISFVTGGIESEPVALQNIVVAHRSVRRVRVGDFAFDQRSVASVVRVRSGVLAVDAVLSSVRGISLTSASSPGALLAGVGAADAGGGFVDVVALGDADAVTLPSLLTPDGQSAFAAIPQAIEPSFPHSVGVGPERSPALGAVIDLADGSPIAGGYRWIVQIRNGNGDVAGIGLGQPGTRLTAVTGEPAGAAQTRLLVANTSEDPALVRIDVISASGRAALPEVRLSPGASVKVPLGAGPGPVGVVVHSDESVIATLGSTVVPGAVWAFAVEGIPSRAAGPVVVEADPRLGIPAR